VGEKRAAFRSNCFLLGIDATAGIRPSQFGCCRGHAIDTNRPKANLAQAAAIVDGHLTAMVPCLQYLVDTVAARAGIPPEEAQQRIGQIYAQAGTRGAGPRCRGPSTQDRRDRRLHHGGIAADRRRRRLFRCRSRLTTATTGGGRRVGPALAVTADDGWAGA
jgi:hypothetical protein